MKGILADAHLTGKFSGSKFAMGTQGFYPEGVISTSPGSRHAPWGFVQGRCRYPKGVK